MEVFSARLKWLREKSGKSQRAMSELIGVSQPYYLKFEKGNGEPNLETLVKLSSVFNESTDFLLGITDYDKIGFEIYESVIYSRDMSGKYLDMVHDMYRSMPDDLMKPEYTERYENYMKLAADLKEKSISLQDSLNKYLSNIPHSNQVDLLNKKDAQ